MYIHLDNQKLALEALRKLKVVPPNGRLVTSGDQPREDFSIFTLLEQAAVGAEVVLISVVRSNDVTTYHLLATELHRYVSRFGETAEQITVVACSASCTLTARIFADELSNELRRLNVDWPAVLV